MSLPDARWFIPAVLLYALFMHGCMEAWAEDIDMGAISTIESSNNPKAYNKHSGAMGTYQITKICLDDYNLYNAPTIARNALYSPEINFKVAQWYMNKRIPQLLRHYKHEDTIENRIIAYNAGISYVGKPLPDETIKYIQKYKELSK